MRVFVFDMTGGLPLTFQYCILLIYAYVCYDVFCFREGILSLGACFV